MPYRLIKQEGAARRGEFTTVHGTVQTPAFQNVATAAAIKAGEYDKAEAMRGIDWSRVCQLVTVQAQLKPELEVTDSSPRIAIMTSGWPAPDRKSVV